MDEPTFFPDSMEAIGIPSAGTLNAQGNAEFSSSTLLSDANSQGLICSIPIALAITS